MYLKIFLSRTFYVQSFWKIPSLLLKPIFKNLYQPNLQPEFLPIFQSFVRQSKNKNTYQTISFGLPYIDKNFVFSPKVSFKIIWQKHLEFFVWGFTKNSFISSVFSNFRKYIEHWFYIIYCSLIFHLDRRISISTWKSLLLQFL